MINKMTIPFYKYQGTGNDFVLIDQREKTYLTRADQSLIERICDRRFGVGADGLMLLQNIEGYDFEMIYFNADGRESTMCGNGGRCICAFAQYLGVAQRNTCFLAIDGAHHAYINAKGNWVELQMINVKQVEQGSDFFVMNTGSPHYVTFLKDFDHLNVYEQGKAIRYNERFAKEGINVNFIAPTENGIKVATYERGVEDETFSCGTGVTAAAIAYWLSQKDTSPMEIPIETKGGQLSVRLAPDGYTGFKDIWLCGPATLVFEGNIEKM
jgi:diaminopimelate epimerase